MCVSHILISMCDDFVIIPVPKSNVSVKLILIRW